MLGLEDVHNPHLSSRKKNNVHHNLDYKLGGYGSMQHDSVTDKIAYLGKGGGLRRICRSHTGQFTAMSAAKCGKFYGMTIKRWHIAKNNRRVNIHTSYEATDAFRGLFFKI